MKTLHRQNATARTGGPVRSKRPFHESDECFRLLVDRSPDAIFVENENGTVLDANPSACQLHRLSREQLIGKNVVDLVPPECREKVKADFSGWFTGRLNSYDGYSLTADGRKIAVEIRSTRLDYGGKQAVMLQVRDVTERKRDEEMRARMEEQMRQTQKLQSLGVLAGGIAHDFNNLLMSILGHADLAMAEPATPSSVREHVENIKKAGTRAAELTGQMLAYAGKGSAVIEPIDLNELVADMVHLLRASISKKATLKCEPAVPLPVIAGDPSRIRQVVMNLLINASEALGDKTGAITLGTGSVQAGPGFFADAYFKEDCEPGLYVFMRVADTGCGMDDATRACIFDPFFSTKFIGRGLGLAVVLGIARSNRGAIKVESSPGAGSTFTVFFPAASPAHVPSKPASAEHKDEHAPASILAVDDEAEILSIASTMLRSCGYQVLTASSGREALRILDERGQDIDLVLLDLTMPDMHGDEVMLKMKRVRPDLRIVLSSGFSETAAVARLDGSSIAGFLQKPYDTKALLKKIRGALRR